MPKLPRISSKEAIRAFERLGFEQVRQTGSHVVMKKETKEGKVGCVIPVHRGSREPHFPLPYPQRQSNRHTIHRFGE